MKFYAEEYLESRYVAMHCLARDDAKIFTRYLHDRGFRWCDGDSLETDDGFRIHGANGLYCFANVKKQVSLTTMYSAATYGYTILEFSDFDWDDEEDEPIEISEEYFQFMNELMGVS